ncbi:hypothetical protein [Nocardia sp. MDA0666]|uniref:hypothetical protein n=1 Tax=Nocardia sp. MDA0666 TaxID=2135448 RepID=UPI0011B278AC|nr:hypothetical protein [Nocardia sp. MDA0666]
MKKFVVAALSSAALTVALTACAHDQEKTCCAAPTSSATATPAPSDDGSGLRRNTSPSPAAPPTSESARPHITLPHITWPKRDPGAGGE